MSYNGIGLKTAKGSATSGHIQRSLADNETNKNKNYHARQNAKDKKWKVEKGKESNKDKELLNKKSAHLESRRNIIKHFSKREIEVQVSELRDKLEDSNEDDEIIEQKCAELRVELVQEWDTRQRLDNAYTSRARRKHEETQEVERTPQ